MSRQTFSGTDVVAADGTALVVFRPVDAWVDSVLQIVAVALANGDGSPYAGAGEARFYLGDQPADDRLVYGTYSGARDSAEPGIVLRGGEPVCVHWTGANPASVARAVFHFDSVQRR